MITYKAHVRDLGWLDPVNDGMIAGTVGQSRALEAFQIMNVDIPEVGVQAFALVQDMGWSAGNIQSEDVGTTGLGKHIEAVKMGLFGARAEEYDIWYRCHVADYGWFDWSCNGAVNGTEGGSRQIEAIQIEIHPKSEGYNPKVDYDGEYINLTPQNPPQNKAQTILDIARSHIGYITGTSKDSVFGRRISGPNAGDWCCYAVVCWALDAGLNVPVTGSCPQMQNWAKATGRLVGDPQPGFFVLYDFGGGYNDQPNGTADHIGIVEEVYSSDDIVAIEGNTDQGNGTGVYRVHRNYNILGYVNPF